MNARKKSKFLDCVEYTMRGLYKDQLVAEWFGKYLLYLSDKNGMTEFNREISSKIRKEQISIDNYLFFLAISLKIRDELLISYCLNFISEQISSENLRIFHDDPPYTFTLEIYEDEISFFQIEEEVIFPLFKIYCDVLGTPPEHHNFQLWNRGGGLRTTKELVHIAEKYKYQIKSLHFINDTYLSDQYLSDLIAICPNLEEIQVLGRCNLSGDFSFLRQGKLRRMVLEHVTDCRQFSFDDAPSLERLEFIRIPSVEKIIIHRLNNLKMLEVFDAPLLQSIKLPSFSELNCITIAHCPQLLHISLDNVPDFFRLLRVINSENLLVPQELIGFLYRENGE